MSVKLIVVPALIHQIYQGWKKRNVNAVAVVNVGIRWSSRRFVAVKSMETFWSKSIFKFIAKKLKSRENISMRTKRLSPPE